MAKASPSHPNSRVNGLAEVRGQVTLRAILIAVVLAVVNDWWVIQLEVRRPSYPTLAAPFYNAIFTLLAVYVLNRLVRRLWPRVALSGAELLTVYVTVSITTAVISRMMLQILVPMIAHAAFYQSPENNWGELFVNRLPHWLTVSDQTSLRNFYLGNSTFYDRANFGPWIAPMIWWSVFGAALLFTLLCLNSILRKQWVEAERLTFPVIQLPLQMADDTGAFYRDRRMWLGFLVAGSLTLLAGLNAIWPSVPCLQITRRNMGSYIVNPPWNAIGNVPVGFYFWAIGLAFLMPIELSFSCWFFFWAIKFERVACSVLGLGDIKVSGGGLDTGFPFLNSQAYGAYLGFFLMSVWNSRKYLGRVWRTAFKGTGEEDESREAVSYRTAILGAGTGFLIMGAFAHRIGMSLWVIPIFFGFYTMLAIIATRIRAELGFPTHDMREMGPQYAALTAFGSKAMNSQNLIAFSMLSWFNREYSSHPAPHQLESFKIAEKSSTPAKQMFNVCLIAGLIAMPLGFWMLLSHFFKWGCGTSHVIGWPRRIGQTTYDELANWLVNPLPPNVTAMGFVGIGFGLSTLMGWMRLRYLWFPLHPLAYAIGHSWGVVQLWTPLFIGGTIKYMLLRFGGLPTYRRALPFFFGLILGEITVGGLWTIIGIASGIQTYDFWPGAMTQ